MSTDQEENYLLSTSDNPWNPHIHWDEWYSWDFPRYDSLSLLARTVRTSNDLPNALQEQDTDDAINTIVLENLSGMHIRVPRPTQAPPTEA